MKRLDTFNFQGKKALVRVDFNVPLNDEYHITDTSRIDAAIPTIMKILDGGGAVILMSHLGRPKEGPEARFSLNHLIGYLSGKLGRKVKFADDCIGKKAEEMAAGLSGGEVLLLENLRFHKEETGGDEDFARSLSVLGDVYVNDAFGTAHRAHASTAIIAQFFPEDNMFGYIMDREIANIDKVVEGAEKPFTAILGGAKVSGKIEIINNLLDKVDNLLIGGGMMFTFIKAMGGQVGDSLVENDLIETAMETITRASDLGVKLFLPGDAVIADSFSNDAATRVADAGDIPNGWLGLDIGAGTTEVFTGIIANSRTLLWNGPMGVFEMSSFEAGTKAVAMAVAEATTAGAFSLIGGGDSVAAINKYDLKDRVSYISTGGGAMLEYIEGKELPGVKAIVG